MLLYYMPGVAGLGACGARLCGGVAASGPGRGACGCMRTRRRWGVAAHAAALPAGAAAVRLSTWHSCRQAVCSASLLDSACPCCWLHALSMGMHYTGCAHIHGLLSAGERQHGLRGGVLVCADARMQLMAAAAECELQCWQPAGPTPRGSSVPVVAAKPAGSASSPAMLEVDGRRFLKQQRWSDAAAALGRALAGRPAPSQSLASAAACAEACGGLPLPSSAATLAAMEALERLRRCPDADAEAGFSVQVGVVAALLSPEVHRLWFS